MIEQTTKCPYCMETIKADAIKCRHCHSVLSQTTQLQEAYSKEAIQSKQKPEGTLWLPIPSLVLGIISVLALFDDSEWDLDTLNGLAVFGIAGLVLGIVSVNTQRVGRGMAIAGISLGAISLLALIGLIIEK